MNTAAKIRIAVIDSVPKKYWADDEGFTDGEKFVALLSAQNSLAEFDIFHVAENKFPVSADDYDGYMLTGSPASVYDEFDWIDRLAGFIREADDRNKRIVASCFGHQLVTKTFGGDVEHNADGWMIGNYPLSIKGDYPWMQPSIAKTCIYHFNEQRVTRLPAQAISFADSEAYSDFGYTIGDNILCFQGHPEQPKRSMNNFLVATDSLLSEDEKALARRMIDSGEPDARIWAEWIMRFFLNQS